MHESNSKCSKQPLLASIQTVKRLDQLAGVDFCRIRMVAPIVYRSCVAVCLIWPPVPNIAPLPSCLSCRCARPPP